MAIVGPDLLECAADVGSGLGVLADNPQRRATDLAGLDRVEVLQQLRQHFTPKRRHSLKRFTDKQDDVSG